MSTKGPELSEWEGPDSSSSGSQQQRWAEARQDKPEEKDESKWQDKPEWQDRNWEERQWNDCKDEVQWGSDGWEEYCADHLEEQFLEEQEEEEEEEEVAEQEWEEWDGETAEASGMPWRIDTNGANTSRERSRSSRRWRQPVVLKPRHRSERNVSDGPKQSPRTLMLATPKSQASPVPKQKSQASPVPKQKSQASPVPKQKSQASPVPKQKSQASPVPKQKADMPRLQKSRASQALASQASQPQEATLTFEPQWLGPRRGNKQQRRAKRIL